MTNLKHYSCLLATLTLLIGVLPTMSRAQTEPLSASGESSIQAAIGPLDTGTQVLLNNNQYDITGGSLSADGQNLIHSFGQFNLGSAQVANFISQPEVQAIIGRVSGGDLSTINGLLQVTGSHANLYLLNPAGLFFGPQARLNLSGSFTTTTADALLFGENTLAAFSAIDPTALVGSPTGFIFSTTDPAGIVNQGQLAVASGESLRLLAGHLDNQGGLQAPGGDITLLAVPGEDLVRLSQPGMLLSLEITPWSLASPLSWPEQLTGSVSENASIASPLPDGSIRLSGTLDTSQPSNTLARGGNISVLGEQITIREATLQASSDIGGGAIRIGGDYQGQGTLPRATTTRIAPNVSIAADARTIGEGGSIVIWADQTTTFAGNASAQGGVVAGDGGLIEVSGKNQLIYRGQANTQAVSGEMGLLLLDPTDIVIRNGTQDGDDSGIAPNALGNDPNSDVVINPADATPTILYESELEGMGSTTNLLIQASNRITIEDLADNALTFQPLGAVDGSISFIAGGDFVIQDRNDTLITGGRSLSITANTITTGNLDTSGNGTNGGSIVLQATGAVNTGDLLAFTNQSDLQSGDILITGSAIQAENINAEDIDNLGGEFNNSQVILTATRGDIQVSTVSAGGRGIDINAAGRFQATGSGSLTVLVSGSGDPDNFLDPVTDQALINFLSKGDPTVLANLGLLNDPDQIVIMRIPASVFTRPSGTDSGPITIRQGGPSLTTNNPNITIVGTNTIPDLQFVVGPNADHSIIPFAGGADFQDFTVLFDANNFPADASGATGAILIASGNTTLVSSLQNRPFVPTLPGVPTQPNNPNNPSSPTTPSLPEVEETGQQRTVAVARNAPNEEVIDEKGETTATCDAEAQLDQDAQGHPTITNPCDATVPPISPSPSTP